MLVDSTPEMHASELIERQIGMRIRQMRVMRKMSQMHLAAKIQLSYQQLQKYESGENKCSIAKLALIAKALNCRRSDLLPNEDAGVSELEFIDSLPSTIDVRLINRISKLTLRQRRLVANLVAELLREEPDDA